MQTIQFQKNKLELIEQIIQCENHETIEAMKSLIEKENKYSLSDEEKLILDNATEKYYSVEEPSFSWEEVKNNARKIYEKRA